MMFCMVFSCQKSTVWDRVFSDPGLKMGLSEKFVFHTVFSSKNNTVYNTVFHLPRPLLVAQGL